jgi:hypothetical protein
MVGLKLIPGKMFVIICCHHLFMQGIKLLLNIKHAVPFLKVAALTMGCSIVGFNVLTGVVMLSVEFIWTTWRYIAEDNSFSL